MLGLIQGPAARSDSLISWDSERADMILTGRNIRAKKALQTGLLDEMVHPSILRESRCDGHGLGR